MGKPFVGKVERWGQVEDVSTGLLQIGQRCLTAQQNGAGVDLVHQVETLEFDVLNPGQFDRPGVVYQRIDRAEMFIGLGQCLAYGDFIAHVHLQGQRLAASGFHFLRHTENRPWQLGVGFGTFGRDHDVGAITRSAQSNLAADTTAGTGDEQGFALQ
ncbi:hypothetical protein D3C72_1645640 [compost metagenome]